MIDLHLKEYEAAWRKFHNFIEAKAEGRCIITNKNWRKLRDIHMNMYLQQLENPFYFLFQVKMIYPEKYRTIPSMPKYYGIYKSMRQDLFTDSI